jgi:hypothetical protein
VAACLIFRVEFAMRLSVVALCVVQLAVPCGAAENQLTESEKAAGWILLFDGKTTNGWVDSRDQAVDEAHVQDGCLNPHPCNYMLVYKEPQSDFELALDFKLSPHCNSGVFVRTSTLTPRPGKDVGFNGLEIALDDTSTAGFHDTGAIYDLVKPSKNAMKPIGQWNQLRLTCNKNLIDVVVNGESVTRMNLDEWVSANKRPDGSDHKFDVAYKEHPRRGFIGLQDHGSDVWFRNIKLRKLK